MEESGATRIPANRLTPENMLVLFKPSSVAQAREQGRYARTFSSMTHQSSHQDQYQVDSDQERVRLLERFSQLGQSVPASFNPWENTSVPGGSPPGHKPVRHLSIPGYELLNELGRGGMGVVYQARQASLNRIVALKMVLSGAYTGEVERRRFIQEAQSVARLKHPNIVQVFDFGEHHGHLYYAMEYLEGGNLTTRIKGKPQPATWAAQFVEVLARAVQHAHEAGILHRDLKPDNIFLTADGTPKIGDFGLARHTHQQDLTASGVVVGTPNYMAPEQAVGRTADIGPATDVYALGTILYELLTGRPPFRSETTLETLTKVCSEEPVTASRFNPILPRDLETVCMKCLSKEPSQRYPTAEALADDLKRFLAAEPVCAVPLGRIERLWRKARRYPVPVALSIIVLLLTGFVLYSQLTRPLDPDEELLHAVADLDRLEPGWRLEQLEAARLPVADDKNAALQTRAAAKLLPARWLGSELVAALSEWETQSPITPLNDRQVEVLRKQRLILEPAVTVALRLADRNQGRHTISWSRNGIDTVLRHAQETRDVVTLLEMEALLGSHDRDIERALKACQAAFNAGRSLGTEPLSISQLVRLYCSDQCVRLLERIVAQGAPSESTMIQLQNLLLDEAAHPALLIAARGDRGGIHWRMSAFEAGDIQQETYLGTSQKVTAGPISLSSLRRAHVWALQTHSRFVRFSALPDHQLAQRKEEWAESAINPPPDVKRLDLLPATKMIGRFLHSRAAVQCAATALAVERYRQQLGRWPENLQALVGGTLHTIPLDPYDGNPLRYRLLNDGIVIYSVGPDHLDDLGKLNSEHADIGFRLWNVALRHESP